jgi:hypothetical protein
MLKIKRHHLSTHLANSLLWCQWFMDRKSFHDGGYSFLIQWNKTLCRYTYASLFQLHFLCMVLTHYNRRTHPAESKKVISTIYCNIARQWGHVCKQGLPDNLSGTVHVEKTIVVLQNIFNLGWKMKQSFILECKMKAFEFYVKRTHPIGKVEKWPALWPLLLPK